MLFSDLAGKEIINLHDGAKLGVIGDADLAVSGAGVIEALILNTRAGFGGLLSSVAERDRDGLIIPWQAVRKIGSEVMIVDLPNTGDRISDRLKKYSI
ncbi:MAG: YlmC/YmxH family sporulation protein [Peptococcaceae bacterium]|jgi:YlmC/YmxH family sporulation protein|nr:YlmC/YmxH family sporulation protein [Peptococcaceae bacterium]